MKVGICLPNYGPATDPAAIRQVATAAEEAGYDSVWVTDHILVPEEHAATFGQVIEVLVTLGYLAAVTGRVSLGTSILVLPQRDPILVAKQAAAVDQLSGGRLILGVGAGWMAGEFDNLGVDFRRRGRMMDEWIRLMRALWTEPEPAFEGEWFHFAGAVFEPKPLQAGGPPLWIGGNSDAAMRRAATLGDGWHPGGLDPAALAAEGARLSQMAGNRSVALTLRLVVALNGESKRQVTARGGRLRLGGSASEIGDTLHEYAAAGLEHLVCYFEHQTAAELVEQVERFAANVMPGLPVSKQQ
jgi:probable F420-dependent oxidoreductase